MKKTRTEFSLLNIKYAIIGQFIGLGISFVTRFVFVRFLDIQYLGVDGLFVNVLSILSLLDLGLGTAVIYSLYEPLANDNTKKICLLINLYKKYFRFIALAIFFIGLIITPFINHLIKEVHNIPYLKIIFLLFVIDTIIGYFFAHKRLLIIADQKRYITSIYRYSFFFLLNIFQIILLIIFKNYLIYLFVKILFNILENLFISRKANKLYPYIHTIVNDKIDLEEKNNIIKNIKALSMHKLGGVVVKGTDNILISKLIGVKMVGIYSNYNIIINSLNLVFSIFFNNITASIGNLVVTSSNNLKNNFDSLNFLNYLIYTISTIAIFSSINIFVTIWIGDKFLLNNSTILIISLNFYLDGMRKSVLTYREALGLFWYDRHKPIVESFVNLIFSLFLGLKYGINGILIGTTISLVFVCLTVEPYILFKYGLKQSVLEYYVNYAKNFLIFLISGFIVHFISKYTTLNIYFKLFFNMIYSLLIPTIIIYIFYYKSTNLKLLLTKLKQIKHIIFK